MAEIAGVFFCDSELHYLELSFLKLNIYDNLIFLQSWDVDIAWNLISQVKIQHQ
jgi:hypothetical protein